MGVVQVGSIVRTPRLGLRLRSNPKGRNRPWRRARAEWAEPKGKEPTRGFKKKSRHKHRHALGTPKPSKTLSGAKMDGPYDHQGKNVWNPESVR